MLERPRVARLLLQRPVRLGDRLRAHQLVGREVRESLFAAGSLDSLAHESRIDTGIDDEMCDVDVLRSQLARGTLRNRTQAELGAGERRVSDAAPQARRRAGKKDAAAAARHHVTRSLACGEEAGVAAHFPYFAEHALGGFEQREVHIRADVENADFERRVLIGVGEEPDDLFFFACVQGTGYDATARVLDVSDQWCELVAIASAGKDRKSGRSEAPRNRCTDIVARADDGGGRVPLRHAGLLA